MIWGVKKIEFKILALSFWFCVLFFTHYLWFFFLSKGVLWGDFHEREFNFG
jgi:hypothetical protein